MIHTILSHPGGAHKDDLLAACVLAALHNAPIVRRDPTDDDLDDEGMAVIDIGGRHQPALNNFDHHHFDREHPPTCSLSLLLQHLGLYDDAKLFCAWLEPAEYFDSRGPNKTADWLGVPRKAIAQLNSPIDFTLLRRFAAQAEHKPGETLYEYMKFVGQDLLDFLHSARARIAYVEEHGTRWQLPHDGHTIEAVFLPRDDEGTGPAEEPSAAVANYIRAKGLDDVVHAIVYPDRRGTGYGIGRYEDHPRFDFAHLEAEDDVRFAHKSGFMLKTEATSIERLQELVRMGWKSDDK
ncbi:MAG: hypothetical protein GY822_04825 [Deltaproteobacteria bacterium]|nr:hypothetical protein [Deltaproteobacteria bacterium]